MANLKFVLVLFIFFYSCSKNEINKIYFNGSIWTGDRYNPFATAIALENETIVFVGNDAQVLQMASDKTEKINLSGHFVTPGFIDNHVHFISGGLQLSRLNLNNVTSKKEFQQRLVEYEKKLIDGAWILGGNWDHELWGGQYPNKSWIDDVISDRPVLLDRLDGHMALANSYALKLASIGRRRKILMEVSF